ncbi:MAG: BspA family leucine-rich repeat surface protein, partial [Cytophagales bacterium]
LIDAGTGNDTNFGVNNSGNWVQLNLTGITDGWHHMAMVASGTNFRVYVDGIQVAETTGISGTIQSNPVAQMDIGHDVRYNARYGKNRYDNFRVWNIALSQADIQANRFRTITSTLPGLVAAYDFNSGIPSGSNLTVTSLNDISGNNRNGILNGFNLNLATSNWVASNTTINGSYAFTTPSVTGITSSKTVCSGLTVPLSVTATGTSLTYQWFRNNVLISGATASLYNVINITSIGTYFVSVTGLGGSVTSSGINVSVQNCDFITLWDLSNVGASPIELTFGVGTSGTANYSWETFPLATLSGTGTFSGTTFFATGLPVGQKIKLGISPTNFNRIDINLGSDKSRLIDIIQWGGTIWSSFQNAFSGCDNLEGSGAIDTPNLSNVTSFQSMFYQATKFNHPIGNWNTSNIINMDYMFYLASAFNQPIGGWNTSNVTSMHETFPFAYAFNQPLANWDVSQVTNMRTMFYECNSFNQPIGNWNTGNVTSMNLMFYGADLFNQSLSGWNVSKVADMDGMFENATAFNQNLGAWGSKLNPSVLLGNFVKNSGLNTSNYDALLIGFNSGTVTGRSFSANNLSYCSGASARNNLTSSKSWTINDAGLNTPLIVTQPTNSTICVNSFNIFSVSASGLGIGYAWGDGSGNILGTGNTFTTNVVGNYNATITGGCTNLVSNSASLIIINCNNSLNFNGSGATQVIPVPALAINQPSFTVEFWVKPALTSLGRKITPFSFHNISGVNTDKFFIQFDDASLVSDLTVETYYFNRSAGISTLPIIKRGQWSHIALATNPTTGVMNLYVNAVLVSSTTSAVNSTTDYTAGAEIKMGEQVNSTEKMVGSLDELRVWQGMRTAQEIFDNYAISINNTISGLLVNATFNESPSTQFTNQATGIKYNRNTATFSQGFIPGPRVGVKGNNTFIVPNSIPIVLNRTNFGSISLGSPITRSFSIQNIGTTTLGVSSVAVSGANASDFVLSGFSASNLTIGGLSNFNIQFNPSSGGEKNAKVTLTSTDAETPNFVFSITGIVTIPGGALSFDAFDDYAISKTEFLGFNNEFTLEAWINAANTFYYDHLISKYSGNISDYSYFMGIENGKLIGHIQDNNNNIITLTSTGTIGVNQWKHVAMTWRKEGTMNLYIDGILSATTMAGVNILGDGPGFLTLGKNLIDNRVFAGKIDQVKVWKRALSEAEIQSRLSCNDLSASTTPNLIAYYDFNQGNAGGNNSAITEVINRQGNVNYNLVLSNFGLTDPINSNFVAGNPAISTTCGEFLFTDLRVLKGGILVRDGLISASTINGTDFGIQTYNNWSQEFVLENKGLSNITISGINIPNSAFTHTLTSNIIPPNGSTTLIISNFPTILPGVLTSSVIIISNDHTSSSYDFAIAANLTAPGTGLSFDGVNDFVNIPYTSGMPTGNSDFTFEAFIRPFGGESGVQWFAAFGNSSPNQGVKFGVDVDLVNNTYQIIANNNNDSETISIPGFSTNFYNHISFVYKAASKTLSFMQGLDPEPNVVFSTNLSLPASGNLQLGTFNSNPSFASDVVLDEVRIWNRALTFDEIQSRNSCKMTNTILGIAVHYDFNQNLAYGNNVGNIQLLDRSGNGKNGTLSNFSLTGSGSNWALTDDSPLTLYGSGTCPTVSGASFTVTGNGNFIANNSTLTSIALGNDFGTRTITQTVVKAFRIINGNESVQITKIGSGNYRTDYTDINTPFNLVANATLDFNVSFTGVSLCFEAKTVDIETNSVIIPKYIIPVSGYTDYDDFTVTGSKTVCGNGFAIITVSGAQTIESDGDFYPVEYSLYDLSHQLVSGPKTISGAGPFTFTTPVVSSVSGFYVQAGLAGVVACVKTLSGIVNVVVGSLPTVTGSVTPTQICANETATFSGAGAASFNWTNGVINNESTSVFSTDGFYTVTGTNASGCSNSAIISLTVNSLPIVDIGRSETICLGDSFGITATGSNITSYQWNNGDNKQIIQVSPTISSFYNLTATGLNNCKEIKGVTISVNPKPVLSSISGITTYGTNYNESLGSNTLSFSLIGGNLPDGLTLSNDLISGIPTVIGFSNFTITGGNGSCSGSEAYSIDVQKADLIATIQDMNVFQLAPFPTNTFNGTSFLGLKLNDSFNMSYKTAISNTNTLGSFDINGTISGTNLSKYNITVVSGKLNIINPEVITVIGVNVSREYGNPDPEFTGTVLGINPSFPNITISYYTNTNELSNFGKYPIFASITGIDASRYALVSNTVGSLTIRTRRLIVRTFDYTIAEGQPFPETFPTTIIGLLAGSAPLITFETQLVPGETKRYNIIPEIAGVDLNFYSLVLFPGILYVRPAITIIGNNLSKTYGQPNPIATGTLLGVLPEAPYVYVNFVPQANLSSTIGGYDILPVISGSDAAKYGYVTILGMLEITKANLTIAAANSSRSNTDTSPFVFQPVFTGLVNNDQIHVDLFTDAPDLSTLGEDYNIYPISISGERLNNYNISTLSGVLKILNTVPPIIPITVTAGTFTRKYGELEQNYGGTIEGTISNTDNVIISYSTNANTQSSIGNYALFPVISGTDLYKYSFTTVAGRLNILANTLTVTALNYTREYGVANPPFFNTQVSGLLNADVVSVSSTVVQNQLSPVGLYPILPIINSPISANYEVITVVGELSITKA